MLLFPPMGLTVGMVDELFSEKKKRQPVSRKRRVPGSSRNPIWIPDKTYILVRTGIRIERGTLDDLLLKGELTEAHLYHFQHEDEAVTRESKCVPRYVACFRVKDDTGTYCFVRAQHKYLQSIYGGTRKDLERAHDILKDRSPYWTDKYLRKMLALQRARSEWHDRHQPKKRKKK